MTTINALPLAGRTALVTGGGTGVGLGISRRLLASGAEVTSQRAGSTCSERAAATLRKEIPGAIVRPARCDTTVEHEVAAAVAAASEGRRHLDIAVANASTLGGGPILASDPSEWMSVVNVHVVGAMLLIEACSRGDGGRGRRLDRRDLLSDRRQPVPLWRAIRAEQGGPRGTGPGGRARVRAVPACTSMRSVWGWLPQRWPPYSCSAARSWSAWRRWPRSGSAAAPMRSAMR